MQTPRLALPLLAPQQAQKHVTVNEALMQLDMLSGLCVKDMLAQPPAKPSPGECWLVGPNAQGLWSGQQGRLARFDQGGWLFHALPEGQLLYVGAAKAFYVNTASGWVAAPLALAALALNGASTAHPFAVAGATSLFDHAGAGHQIILNKAAPAHNAAVLFQSAHAGCAETGLTGDNHWHVKTSPDGRNWREALIIDQHSAIVKTPQRPAFYGALLNWDTVYGIGDRIRWQPKLNRGGLINAAADAITLPVAGHYQVMLTAVTRTVSSYGSNYLALYLNNSLYVQTSVATTVTPALMQLEAAAGDVLDVRNILGSGARYWPETTLNVIFMG